MYYARFCEGTSRDPFPVKEETVILFLSQLHRDGLTPGTMKSYLAAIRYEQIKRGLRNPEICKMPRVEYGVKGAKRLKPGSHWCRLSITPEIMAKLREV